MHMQGFPKKGVQKPPTGKAHTGGGKSTTDGFPHGEDKKGLEKGAKIDRSKMPGVVGGEKFGSARQMSEAKQPGGGGHGAVRGGGSGPSGNNRNFSTKTSAGGWSGPICTMKAGMKSAITERQKR